MNEWALSGFLHWTFVCYTNLSYLNTSYFKSWIIKNRFCFCVPIATVHLCVFVFSTANLEQLNKKRRKKTYPDAQCSVYRVYESEHHTEIENPTIIGNMDSLGHYVSDPLLHLCRSLIKNLWKICWFVLVLNRNLSSTLLLFPWIKV